MSLRAQLLIIGLVLGVPALSWSISTGMLTLAERGRSTSPDGKVQARVVSRGDWEANTHVYLEVCEPDSVTYVALETISGSDEIGPHSYVMSWPAPRTIRVLGRDGNFTRYWDIEIGPEKVYFELRTTPPEAASRGRSDTARAAGTQFNGRRSSGSHSSPPLHEDGVVIANRPLRGGWNPIPHLLSASARFDSQAEPPAAGAARHLWRGSRSGRSA